MCGSPQCRKNFLAERVHCDVLKQKLSVIINPTHQEKYGLRMSLLHCELERQLWCLESCKKDYQHRNDMLCLLDETIRRHHREHKASKMAEPV